MKKITCFIVILFLLQLFAVQWIFIGLHRVHQQKVLRRNSSEHVIAIDTHDAVLLNSHELRYKGKLYDIVRREGKKLYCIADKEEEDLLSSLNDSAGFGVDVMKSKVSKVKNSFSDYLQSVRVFLAPVFTNGKIQVIELRLVSCQSPSVAPPPPEV